ncbi:hypothetical protein PV325_001653 [Microctonus aethiopoides]|nr:hypothetical protein PV325_001653 [Microctonus aethiopoides]
MNYQLSETRGQRQFKNNTKLSTHVNIRPDFINDELLICLYVSVARRIFERGDEESCLKLKEKMPRRIKKMQQVGTDGWTKVFDFEFPENISQHPSLKLIESAKLWKKQKI